MSSIPHSVPLMGLSSAVRRELLAPEIFSSTPLTARSMFPEGSTAVDYFSAAMVILLLITILPYHIYLLRRLHIKGRSGLMASPFRVDEVERGFTFSQVASSIRSQVKHLISFSPRGRSKNGHGATTTTATTEFGGLSTAGAGASGFTESNVSVNKPRLSAEGKGLPLLPLVSPYTPLKVQLPANTRSAPAPPPYAAGAEAPKANSVAFNAARPRSPINFPLPSIVRTTNIKGSSPMQATTSNGGVSVSMMTETHRDRSDSGSSGKSSIGGGGQSVELSQFSMLTTKRNTDNMV
ncbi:hypothetical protein DL93DRAFT_2080825 [Clavulina sp. PMI_390]|nr:hypothetical protein DL93DRAFT_2080825 [Clavulina sp. PMI_390]